MLKISHVLEYSPCMCILTYSHTCPPVSALRAEALRNVESTIVELGTIFNKLGEMVAQQV